MKNKTTHIDSVYRQQNKKLLGFIMKSLPVEQAEDVLHDVFARFFVSYDSIRDIENVTSWLYKTATNRIIDLKRKKMPDLLQDKQIRTGEEEVLFIEDVLPAFSDDPEEELFHKVIWDEIIEGLEEMSEEQKEVFVLHEFEDRSFIEISKITGEKVNTLISRKRYAVLHLREKLNELYKQLKY